MERAIPNPSSLSKLAMREELSRGRRFHEPRHRYRTEYSRDRDRIIHARAFRRLEAKTQVFTTRYSDHFRNRLTHTLEVTQIARTVSTALGLNSELAEALALVHDIGHPPFGHAGERKLNELMQTHGVSFDHNLHALRIVERFEHRYLEFTGLNLTFEVREGIIKHSRDYQPGASPDLAEYLLDLRPPLESQLIDWVDEIAYNTADLDDAREAELLDFDLLRAEVPQFAQAYAWVDRAHPSAKEKLKFSEALKDVLNALASDLIETTAARTVQSGVSSVEGVRRWPERLAGMSPQMSAENARLKHFLVANIYSNPVITSDRDHSIECLARLFHFYLGKLESMPPDHEQLALTVPRHIVVCDYIAGMTDQFLLKQYRDHFASSAFSSIPPL
jgi:dGTPase